MMSYDDVIMRTIIDLPESQLTALASLCKERNISRAEAIRQALADMLAKEKRSGCAAAFGAWKSKKLNSRKHVEKLRGEWD